MAHYVAPARGLNGFNCPLCSAFSKQQWSPAFRLINAQPGQHQIPGWWLGFCDHCSGISVWMDDRMVHPRIATAPLPNPDLPADVKQDYEEARAIMDISPRGAAALLRLAVQRFCKHLGRKGENINADIAELVKNGLPEKMQQSLDAVRVIGNHAVHPGQIDITDDRETASSLFDLVNIVCDYVVSQPKRIEETYGKIPQAFRDAIKTRDNNKP